MKKKRTLPEALRRNMFKKGQPSANPLGRAAKRGKSVATIIDEYAGRKIASGTKTNLEAVIDRLFVLAKAGDIKAAELIFDRLEGKAVQAHRLIGPGFDLGSMSPEERRERIVELESRRALPAPRGSAPGVPGISGRIIDATVVQPPGDRPGPRAVPTRAELERELDDMDAEDHDAQARRARRELAG